MSNRLQRFLGELRRRNVLRVGAAFLIAGWVALQVVDILGPALGLPDWVIVAVAVVVVSGLPIALAVAWFFEITPGGMIPTHEVSPENSIALTTGRRIDRIIIALLALALVFFIGESVYRNFSPTRQADALPLGLAVFPPVIESSSDDAFGVARQVAEEISRALTAVSKIPVTPLEVVDTLRIKNPPEAAAAELGVRYLLLFDPDRTQGAIVSVRLFDVELQESIWSGMYRPGEDDALEFQQRVSQQVAIALGVLSVAEANSLFSLPTENAEAYSQYLLGMQELSRSGYDARKADSLAVALFRNALALDSRFALPHAALCRIELSRFGYNEDVEAFEKAERHCHRALTLGRSAGEVHIALGDLYNSSGQSQRAEESYLEALSISPSYIAALLGLARAYDNQGDASRAEEMYMQAIRVQPSYYSAHLSLADHFYQLGDYDRAQESYVLASRLAPDDPMVLNDIGTTYLLRGDFENAELSFRRSLGLNSEEPYALGNLATTYYFQHRFEDALPLYEKGLATDVDSATAWRNLGDVLRAIGEVERAQKAFGKTIELGEALLEVNPQDTFTVGTLIAAHSALNNEVRTFELISILKSLGSTHPGATYDIAVGFCRLRRLEECLSYVVIAQEEGFPEALLNAEPDFRGVVEQLELPVPSGN